MGSRGPIAKPAGVRQNRNPHAELVILEPALTPAPRPPGGLGTFARTRWDAFWSSPISAAVDREADMGRLVRWAWAWDELVRARSAFRRARMVDGSKGQPVLNPLEAYIQHLQAEIAGAEQQFGMTPASRARLGLVVGQARLTAEQLNEVLGRKRPPRPGDAEPEEWEEGFVDA